MTMCVFGHDVFGVEIEINQELMDLLEGAIEDEMFFADDIEDRIRDNMIDDPLVEIVDIIRRHMIEKIGVTDSPLLKVFYTGSQDDRPGECNTEPEAWLFGIGKLGIVDYALSKPVDLRILISASADWHSWVTC